MHSVAMVPCLDFSEEGVAPSLGTVEISALSVKHGY